MRGWVALLLLLAAPVAGAQEVCRFDYGMGSFEVPCGDEASGPAEEEAWYATNTFQAILGVVGILLSVGGAGYAYYRVRARRQTLATTLANIDRAYASAKADPATGAARLAELRTEVRAAHAKGKMDDAHYLELDKRATAALVKLRLLDIDRRFAHLPPLLLAELRRLLGDGMLTQVEADLIEVRAAAYRIADADRRALVELTRAWAAEDAPVDDDAPAVVAR